MTQTLVLCGQGYKIEQRILTMCLGFGIHFAAPYYQRHDNKNKHGRKDGNSSN